jgi:hypothetical protein
MENESVGAYLFRVFKLMSIFVIFMVITASILIFHNYMLHKPKNIEQYTYKNNTLFFKLPKSTVDYELTLPKDASFSSGDKLSIALINKYDTPKKDLKTDLIYMKYGVKPMEYHQDKEINLFVNDTLKYDLKDKLVLKKIYKDPDTGVVTETVFE